jgi:hypothetical protein
MRTYEVWDQQSANRLGGFASPDDALDLVIQIVEANGEKAVETLVYGVEESGHPAKIASGRDLLAMAKRSRMIAAS